MNSICCYKILSQPFHRQQNGCPTIDDESTDHDGKLGFRIRSIRHASYGAREHHFFTRRDCKHTATDTLTKKEQPISISTTKEETLQKSQPQGRSGYMSNSHQFVVMLTATMHLQIQSQHDEYFVSTVNFVLLCFFTCNKSMIAAKRTHHRQWTTTQQHQPFRIGFISSRAHTVKPRNERLPFSYAIFAIHLQGNYVPVSHRFVRLKMRAVTGETGLG